MKPLSKAIVAAALLATTMSWAQKATLNPAFRKEAWRALNAIDRIPPSYSKDSSGELFSNNPSMAKQMEEKRADAKHLILDAEKAVDEAKYDATASDKHVLFLLQTALASLELQGNYSFSDPKFKPFNDRYAQCVFEARYYLEPDQLDEKQLKQAKLKTCDKKTDEWDSGIWK